MQKKLIALAIAGLSGAAFAQSNVTVYGQVNMAYQNASGTKSNTAGALGAAGAVGTVGTQSQTSLAQLDSRIGFKGEEALGNDLKAVFTLEYNIAPDQAGANQTSNSAASGGNSTDLSGLQLGARQTFAGLKGNFGTFTYGRQYTPFFDAAALLDPFGVSTGNVASAARINPIAAIARADNSFKYVSPMIGGNFLVAAMIGLSERSSNAGATAAGACTAPAVLTAGLCVTTAGGNVTAVAAGPAAAVAATHDTGKLWNWKVAYINGPIIVGLTQIKLTDNAAGSQATGATTKATAIGGTYDMKVVKLHILNDRVKVETAGGTAADRNDWMFGATVPMGAHTIKAQYSKVDERSNNALTTGDVTANDANHLGLGYSYAMSKRTNVFFNYGKVSNKGNATFNIQSTQSGGGTLGGASAAGYTTGYQLGMGHSF